MFDDPAEFPSGEEFISRDVPVDGRETTVVLEGLPPGTYALALHHDENGNGEMDTGLLGIPQEGYGFSNDAPVFLGAPPFSEAAFSVSEDGKSIAVQVIY